jgi:large subunit ribosomal protein L4
MAAKVLTIEAARKAKVPIVENGKGTQAVHEVIVALRAARRSGTANTKTKAEVNLSGAKPWRQKGTGRARAGYKSTPVWVGGGVVFGPKPRDYSKTVSRSVRRLALRKALSLRIASGDVLVVESFGVKEPKTKQFIAARNALTPEEKVLIIAPSFDEKTFRAARNVARTQLATAAEVNTEQLLAFKKIVITNDALETLAARTSES